MSYLLLVVGYGAIALAVGIVASAVRDAEMQQSEYAEHWKHVANCGICDPPRLFWNGYSCGRTGAWERSGPNCYPTSWSPWALLSTSLFWPALAIVIPARRIRTRLVSRLTARLVDRRQRERDMAEVERLLGIEQ